MEGITNDLHIRSRIQGLVPTVAMRRRKIRDRSSRIVGSREARLSALISIHGVRSLTYAQVQRT